MTATTHAGFVHLRVHSAYSLSEGALPLDELVRLCRENLMPAVAVTDSGNLFSALEFALDSASGGIQPIIGCQIALSRDDELSPRPGMRTLPDQLLLLVQNEEGYRNLLKLVSRAFLESASGEPPQVSLRDLEDHHGGLLALTGGPKGGVGRLLNENQLESAEALLQRLKSIFPGRLYVELMRHGLIEESRIEGDLIDLAYKHDLPLLATNEVFFADPDMFEAQDALICIAEKTYVSESNRRHLSREHYFKSAFEMRELFADLPEAVDNTLVVAKRCSFFPRPRDPMLPSFATVSGRSEGDELRFKAAEGLQARLETHVFRKDMNEEERKHAAKPYFHRLEFELEVIIQMGFSGYFLIVADFIQWAKGQGIPVGPGRGSGAGSLVAWVLTITDLDPLRFGLLFERFLNPERVSMPDFDIDFCQERRDDVIRYVQEKYGRDRVAQIITFGTLQARAALRDVGRVLQIPYPVVDRICKLVPNNPANPVSLATAIGTEPRLQQARDEDPAVARMMDIAMKLEGLYRHASTHAAGVVIGDRPLNELIPLYRDPHSDMPVTQFSMKHVEKAGLVKFDFLGLKTLTVLARAVELIRSNGGKGDGPLIDLSTIPLDDEATFAMLARAETVGVFQLESAGMRDVLRKLQADRFEEIIAVVALYRPGPMDNIPSFIARKHGREKPDYMDDRLEEILKETYGIMIYQEQVMQIAQVLSGFTLGSADLLRRAMGKKIQSEMDAQRRHFVEGAVTRGMKESKAHQVFDQVNKFAGYGFNKSHAAAYALVAYQTAYLKANYPLEFLAASMTLDLGNTDKLNVFRQEVERLGFRVLPPDINKSDSVFSVGTDTDGTPVIRYALGAIKNVGEGAMRELVADRLKSGPFKDLSDFAQRLDTKVVNKRQIENLVMAGAFDCLEPNRARVFAVIETMTRVSARALEARQSAQESLFGGESALLSEPPIAPPAIADWLTTERLAREFDALGFYLSAHPLDAYASQLKRLDVLSSNRLLSHLAERGNGHVIMAGTIIGRKERVSARGNRFAFIQLSDKGGVFEVVAFSEILASAGELLEVGHPVLATLEARMEDESARLMLQKVVSLDQAAAQAPVLLRIRLADEAGLESLSRVMAGRNAGRQNVSLVLHLAANGMPAREVEIALPGGYGLAPSVLADLKSAPGIAGIEEV